MCSYSMGLRGYFAGVSDKYITARTSACILMCVLFTFLQVEKVEVTYAKRSKQVDVKALKDTIWGLMEEQAEDAGGNGTISMKRTLALIPPDCPAAPIEDISVHLCFISLLHLANENSLALTAPETMDEVNISGFHAH